MSQPHPRQSQAEVDAQFLQRWSPRAFSDQPVEQQTLLSLLEAARWAPSAANEQPWLFLVPENEEALQRFRSLLNPGNQRWACRAPLLLYLLGRRNWSRSGQANYTYQFDCGSAFMSLALQATKQNLFVHPMAGFDREKAYEVLRIDKEKYDIIVAVAVGYYGDAGELPQDLQEREHPSRRKDLPEIYS